MKPPMFAIETDPVEGLTILVTRPDGTRVVIRGGQSSSNAFGNGIHRARNLRASWTAMRR